MNITNISFLLALLFTGLPVCAQTNIRIYEVTITSNIAGALPELSETADEMLFDEAVFADIEKQFTTQKSIGDALKTKNSLVAVLHSRVQKLKEMVGTQSHPKNTLATTIRLAHKDPLLDVVLSINILKKTPKLCSIKIDVIGHAQPSAALINCIKSIVDESTVVERHGVKVLAAAGAVVLAHTWWTESFPDVAVRAYDRVFSDAQLTTLTYDKDKIIPKIGDIKFDKNEQSLKDRGLNIVHWDTWNNLDVYARENLSNADVVIINLSTLVDLWRKLGKAIFRNPDGGLSENGKGNRANYYQGDPTHFNLNYSEAFHNVKLPYLDCWQNDAEIAYFLKLKNVDQIIVVDDLGKEYWSEDLKRHHQVSGKTRRIGSRFWRADASLLHCCLGSVASDCRHKKTSSIDILRQFYLEHLNWNVRLADINGQLINATPNIQA